MVLVQAATLPPHQPATADPAAFVRMQLEQFVNASEVDGLTPFHLAMINGITPTATAICRTLHIRFSSSQEIQVMSHEQQNES